MDRNIVASKQTQLKKTEKLIKQHTGLIM